jgi:cobalamin synthase
VACWCWLCCVPRWARTFVRRIGGYTGDCLGMAQQLAELSIYLVAAAWKWY